MSLVVHIGQQTYACYASCSSGGHYSALTDEADSEIKSFRSTGEKADSELAIERGIVQINR